MLISQKLVAAINEQIGREFAASMQYVALAAYFGSENLPELSSYFFNQAEEEREHAMKFVHHLVEAGERVTVPAISKPKDSFANVEEAVKVSLDWEQEVTRQIYALVTMAQQDGNYITHHFLQWYVDEQLEEVSTMDQLMSVIRRAGDQMLFVEDYIARAGHPEKGKS